MESPSTPEPSRRIIKRYTNRKLYDTRESRYVTLNQIAEMIRAGEDVQIIDNNSKEDLTSVTLAQVIYEQEKAASQRVPSALRDLIHSGGERLMASIRSGSVGRLILRDGQEPEEIPEGAETAPQAPDARTGIAGLVEASRETFEDWQKKLDERVRNTLVGWKPFIQMQGEVRRLSQRIEELESKLIGAARRTRSEGGKDSDGGASE
ncbi:MAG: polyhydroxyalkanoate synthesis regulator DNA-binding domain-containing protein [Deltaproteobacteria bacterium]|nr:polyhydroxyalkanoate synthesis regulator DNA-binding domain-containing protein [Deltaproteobacteria bacterium]